jgi:transcriptional regulator with XRE-family HTH domain
MPKRKIAVDPAATRAIGSRIARLRNARGWSQPILAAKADVETTTISRIETGARAASTPMLLRLAALFDVPLSQLLDESPTVPNDDEAALVSAWRLLGPSSRAAVLSIVRELARSAERLHPNSDSTTD